MTDNQMLLIVIISAFVNLALWLGLYKTFKLRKPNKYIIGSARWKFWIGHIIFSVLAVISVSVVLLLNNFGIIAEYDYGADILLPLSVVSSYLLAVVIMWGYCRVKNITPPENEE